MVFDDLIQQFHGNVKKSRESPEPCSPAGVAVGWPSCSLSTQLELASKKGAEAGQDCAAQLQLPQVVQKDTMFRWYQKLLRDQEE